jgi:hypothetical protein
MDAIQAIEPTKRVDLTAKQPVFLSKKAKKYYMDFEGLFVHKTQAEKRRALFGKDPLVSM